VAVQCKHPPPAREQRDGERASMPAWRSIMFVAGSVPAEGDKVVARVKEADLVPQAGRVRAAGGVVRVAEGAASIGTATGAVPIAPGGAHHIGPRSCAVNCSGRQSPIDGQRIPLGRRRGMKPYAWRSCSDPSTRRTLKPERSSRQGKLLSKIDQIMEAMLAKGVTFSRSSRGRTVANVPNGTKVERYDFYSRSTWPGDVEAQELVRTLVARRCCAATTQGRRTFEIELIGDITGR
jgi:hypothetical protein